MRINEKKLVSVVRPYLQKARAGDWGHALRVAKWVKVLGAGRKDLPVLVASAYVHDIGWSGVAPKGKLNLKKIFLLESKANRNSSRLIAEALKKLDFSAENIAKVQRLVIAADRHKSWRLDEAILVDADNLSKLCREHLMEKYQPKAYKQTIEFFENYFPGRIRTAKAKKLVPKLFRDLKRDLCH